MESFRYARLDPSSAAAAGPFSVGSSYAVEMGALCCKSQQVHTTADQRIEVEVSACTSDAPPTGHLLIFVNPNSGSGKGVKTFRQKVRPELVRNGISYEMVITTGPQHAHQVVRDRVDIGKFNAILILSGDGLVFEVLNGLCERADRSSIVPNLPIGIVPSGSGNGLLASVFSYKGYPLRGAKFLKKSIEVVSSADSIAQPVNLLHVQTDDKNIAAFLSIGWGLLADIDIDSERWRKTLGSNRFTVEAILKCLSLQSYRGRLSYQPYRAGSTLAGSSYPVMAKTAGQRIPSSHSSVSLPSSPSIVDPPIHRALDTEWTDCHLVGGANQLEEPVPDDWTTVEDEFVFVYALSISHIASDGPMMPRARLCDDRMYLTYVLRKDVGSKLDLIKFLVAMESEKHLDFPFFKVVEVSSFRLEPIDTGSYIAIDGELVKTKKIQATVTNLNTAIVAGPSEV